MFEFLALRYEQKSTVITSNLIFSDWIKIFKDKALTMALLDRVTQNAMILDMNGPSYRGDIGKFKEKKSGLGSKFLFGSSLSASM